MSIFCSREATIRSVSPEKCCRLPVFFILVAIEGSLGFTVVDCMRFGQVGIGLQGDHIATRCRQSAFALGVIYSRRICGSGGLGGKVITCRTYRNYQVPVMVGADPENCFKRSCSFVALAHSNPDLPPLAGIPCRLLRSPNATLTGSRITKPSELFRRSTALNFWLGE